MTKPIGAYSLKLNEVGYPVLSNDLHQRVFGNSCRPVPVPSKLERAQGLLRKFNITTPVSHPDNLYDGDLPFPDLIGNDINEHFEAMADEFIGAHVMEADRFASCSLPKAPGVDDIVFVPGWTRYTHDGKVWTTESVPYPSEKAYVFDTETFVTAGAFPVIGSALSTESAYVWLAAEMCDPSLLLFDLGGVLIDWNPEYVFLDVFNRDRKKMQWFFDHICTSDWNENEDAGYPLQKATEERIALFPEHEETLEPFKDKSNIWLQDDPIICKYEKRKGKPITILEGYTGATSDFKILAKEIKTKLSVGGSFKDDKIIKILL